MAEADEKEEKYLLCHGAGHVSATTHGRLNFPVIIRAPRNLDRRTVIFGDAVVH
jgi:hypothetical protein